MFRTAEAACAMHPKALFFPTRPGMDDLPKSICAECPVRRECLEFALRTRQPAGVWGGYTETERAGMEKSA